MKSLHPKIQALRNKVGHLPIMHFNPRLSLYNAKPIEVRRAKSSNERLIQQYFCIFGIPDDYGTVPEKGTFKKSIEERGPKSNASNKIIVLNQHDDKDPMCLPSVLVEDEIGLYAEYEPDPIPSGDRLVIQVKRGTINGGSYGFGYVWDKMEYDEKSGLIHMYEQNLFEVSPVTLPSQKETFVVRGKNGEYIDEFLEEDTESMIKLVPRKNQLELRNLIKRHIALAQAQPQEPKKRTALKKDEPKHGRRRDDTINYDFLISKFLKSETNIF